MSFGQFIFPLSEVAVVASYGDLPAVNTIPSGIGYYVSDLSYIATSAVDHWDFSKIPDRTWADILSISPSKLAAGMTCCATDLGLRPFVWDGGGWVDLTDTQLRGDLAANDGAKLIGSCASIAELRTVSGTYDQQRIHVTSYYDTWAASLTSPAGGGYFRWIAASTAADDGGSVIAVTGVSTGRWYREIEYGVSVKMFGAIGDGVTSDGPAVYNAINYALLSHTDIEIDVCTSSYLVGSLTFNASNYTSTTLSEKGIKIWSRVRGSSVINGEIIFSHKTPYTAYTDRFSGLIFDNICIYNKTQSGDGLTLSGFGKILAYNCIFRSAGATGLNLMGGSEFSAYGCQLQGSYNNLNINYVSLTGETIDASVINFYDCDIANSSSSGTQMTITGYGKRTIGFTGGNIVCSTAPATVSSATLTFNAVDFENTYPINLSNSVVDAINCLFGVHSPKLVLTSSQLNDMGNVWSANEANNIQINDASSIVRLYENTSNPTITITHTTDTIGQIIYSKPLSPFVNNDISKGHYLPYNPSNSVTIDTSLYVTGMGSIGVTTAGTYINFPLKFSKVSLSQIGAIEYIASNANLSFVLSDGSTVVDSSSYGLQYALQTYSNGLKKYVFIPSLLSTTISSIRYTFSLTSTRFDCARIYGDVCYEEIRATAVPTYGTWSVGDKIEIKSPGIGNYNMYKCTTGGSSAVWSGYGNIPLSASATWVPGSIANGARASTTISISGVVGSRLSCGFNQVLGGCKLWAEMTESGTATVYLENTTGSTVTIAQGTITVVKLP